MNKEIHFYDSEYDAIVNSSKPFNKQASFYYGYTETEDAIYNNEEIIHTLQMCCLKTSLFTQGYRVFIHDMDGNYEIKLGPDNDRTNRDIRMEHNILKLWELGEFS